MKLSNKCFGLAAPWRQLMKSLLKIMCGNVLFCLIWKLALIQIFDIVYRRRGSEKHFLFLLAQFWELKIVRLCLTASSVKCSHVQTCIYLVLKNIEVTSNWCNTKYKKNMFTINYFIDLLWYLPKINNILYSETRK